MSPSRFIYEWLGHHRCESGGPVRVRVRVRVRVKG